MIIDGLLLFSDKQDLTAAGAGAATASTNQIDFTQQWDAGVTCLSVFANWNTLPTSQTAGATIDVKLQMSTDNTNWVTVEEFPSVSVGAASEGKPFLVRTSVPITGSVYRYAQIVYTPSAALSSGTVTAGINLDVPANRAYPRNYVA